MKLKRHLCGQQNQSLYSGVYGKQIRTLTSAVPSAGVATPRRHGGVTTAAADPRYCSVVAFIYYLYRVWTIVGV